MAYRPIVMPAPWSVHVQVCISVLLHPKGTDIERLALRISLADIDEQFEKVIQKSLVFILRYLSRFEDHRRKV